VAISFHAEFVDADRQEWGWQIVWSVDDTLAAQRYLIVQRADKPTEQDIRLGMAGVYVECCGQARSWFGHIDSFELCRDRIFMQLDAVAAREMRDDGRIDATFKLSDERFTNLRSALSQVFHGYGYYTETAA
jgi:immunity protein 10 of polymorphic toxin system